MQYGCVHHGKPRDTRKLDIEGFQHPCPWLSLGVRVALIDQWSWHETRQLGLCLRSTKKAAILPSIFHFQFFFFFHNLELFCGLHRKSNW